MLCLGHALACAHRLAWAWLKDLRRQPEGLHVCEVHLTLAGPWLVRGKQARLSQRQQLGSIVQADGGRGRGKLQLVAGWACVWSARWTCPRQARVQAHVLAVPWRSRAAAMARQQQGGAAWLSNMITVPRRPQNTTVTRHSGGATDHGYNLLSHGGRRTAGEAGTATDHG